MPLRLKAHLIDTNVLLRYLVGDVPQQTGKVTALMERLEAGTQRGEVLQSVVAEAVWTLESFYTVPRPEIAAKLATILSFKGVKTTQKGLVVRALAQFGSSSADFVDCLLAAKAQQRSLKVYSFDAKDFRRLGVAWETPS